jgi:hypothetical protein
VDRSSAVRQLPELHAVAIRLRDDGCDDRLIGVALGVDDHQVPMLLRIANSKLTNLMALDSNGSQRTDRIGHRQVQTTQ